MPMVSGVQAFGVELLLRQLLASIAAGPAGRGAAVAELRYLTTRYGPSEIAALARAEPTRIRRTVGQQGLDRLTAEARDLRTAELRPVYGEGFIETHEHAA